MRGSQEPRLKIEPKRALTDGADAGLLMAEYGDKLDEWQQIVIDCWLGKSKAGKYTATAAGLAMPRQNGKNTCLEAREFFGLVINGDKNPTYGASGKDGKRVIPETGCYVYRRSAPGR